MNVKRIPNKKSLALALGLVLLLLLLAALLIPNSSAKYRIQVATGPEELCYNDRLAESFTLSHEHQAGDGNCYYYLLPGTKSTFAPSITITGKTEIPAFLYLEVTGPNVSLNEGWKLLEGVTGLKGGRVYAYGTVLTDKNVEGPITPRITISWDSVPTRNTNRTLRVYAYMIQQEDPELPAEEAFTAAVSEKTEP